MNSKAERLAVSSSTSGMVELMSKNSKETHWRSDTRWKAMMETQQEELKLEREKVENA
jgi:hypothetical protein